MYCSQKRPPRDAGRPGGEKAEEKKKWGKDKEKEGKVSLKTGWKKV